MGGFGMLRRVRSMALSRAVGSLAVRNVLEHPVFVIGCGRSGTTALCRSLGRHPEIAMAGAEAPLHQHLGTIAYEYLLGNDHEYYQRATKIERARLEDSLRRMAFQAVWGEDYGLSLRASRRLVGESAWSGSARRWGAKAFPDQRQAEGLGALFPDARFVHIYRNGIDVVQSMAKVGAFQRLSFAERCEFWAVRVHRYAYLNDWDRAVVVRFDDFVEDPVLVFEGVVRHAGLTPNPAPAQFAASRTIRPLGGADEKSSPKDVLRSRPPAYRDWTTEQRDIFATICGREMAILGYSIPF